MKGRGGLALVLTVLLLAGCNAGPDEGPDEPAEPVALMEAEPEKKAEPSTRVFSLACAAGDGFNPYQCTNQSNRTVLSLLYEPLFTVDASFHAAPYLCEKYEPTGDGRTHTLTLRGNVTFSDGTRLTAEDVNASIKAAMGSPYYSERLKHISSITVNSDRELVITTDAAVGSLDALLNVYIVKADTVNDSVPVGSGPYEPDGAGGLRKRNSRWRYNAPVIQAETVRLLAADTPDAVRDTFEYGVSDLACADPNAGTKMMYHSDYELWDNPTTVMQYIGFNRSSSVFRYEALRCAVSHGIDREAIVSDTAGGFGLAASLPASPSAEFYSKQLAENYDFDEAAFREDLEKRSVSANGDGVLEFQSDYGVQPLNGVMIVCMNSDQRVEAAQAVVNSLNALGFDLTLKALEYDSYVDALKKGNFDLYYGEVRLSPDFDLSAFFSENGSLSFGGCADARAAQLCIQAMENVGNAYNLHQEIMDRGLLCPVLFKVYAIYSARGRVTNLTPCLDGVFLQPIAEETR